MKILMLTDKMDIGGAETHILTLIEELSALGADITLMTSGGVYAENNLKNIVRTVYLPLDKRDMKSILKSKRAIREALPFFDVIHAHTRFTAFISKSARGRIKYPPIVTTAHLDFPTFPFGPLTYWGERTLAVSRDIEEHLIRKYRVGGERIMTTRNSIDYSIFTPGQEREKLIIHTSRIDKDRSRTAFMLTEAAKTILKNHRDWRILIAGTGDMYTKLYKAVGITNKTLGF